MKLDVGEREMKFTVNYFTFILFNFPQRYQHRSSSCSFVFLESSSFKFKSVWKTLLKMACSAGSQTKERTERQSREASRPSRTGQAQSPSTPPATAAKAPSWRRSGATFTVHRQNGEIRKLAATQRGVERKRKATIYGNETPRGEPRWIGTTTTRLRGSPRGQQEAGR